MGAFVKLAVAVLVAIAAGVLVVNATPSSSVPRVGTVTESARLSSTADAISVHNGLVTASSGAGSNCTMTLLNPTSLQTVRSLDSCPAAATNDDVLADEGRLALEIRVMATNARTNKKAPGPVLFSIAAWPWAHSSVAEGGGSIWIYGLASNGWSGPSILLQVSTATGRVQHRFVIAAGDNPYLFVDDDGLWITPSAWGASSCSGDCTLWHVAPGSNRLVAVRKLGVRTQWLTDSGHSIYADVLTGATGDWQQAIWRLDGPSATVAYRTPATLLPSTDFTLDTGYVVVGNAQQGYFTLAENGTSTVPLAIGECDTSAPIRVVRIDPTTGRQSYVGAIPRSVAGGHLDCHLTENQGVYSDGALYVLADDSGDLIADYARVVRVETGDLTAP